MLLAGSHLVQTVFHMSCKSIFPLTSSFLLFLSASYHKTCYSTVSTRMKMRACLTETSLHVVCSGADSPAFFVPTPNSPPHSSEAPHPHPHTPSPPSQL